MLLEEAAATGEGAVRAERVVREVGYMAGCLAMVGEWAVVALLEGVAMAAVREDETAGAVMAAMAVATGHAHSV